MVGLDFHVRIESKCAFTGYLCLGFAYMFLVKQKLTIQVTNINCIKIDLKQKKVINPCHRSFPKLLTISISLNPDITRFFNTSHPMPPAPTTNTLEVRTFSAKSGVKTPVMLAAIFCYFSFSSQISGLERNFCTFSRNTLKLYWFLIKFHLKLEFSLVKIVKYVSDHEATSENAGLTTA